MYRAEEVLQEHGLVGAFDTMVMIHDEELAIIFGDSDKKESNINAIKHGSSYSHDRIGGESDVELPGLTFVELQISSQELAAHLYHRFGVRKGDPVAIICNEHCAAEIVACLACARIGASFVPIDSSWISIRNGEKLSEIILDAKPVAAIVVAGNDSAPEVLALGRLAVHRCALINPDGSAVLTESNISDIPTDIPSLYPDSDADDEGDESPEDRSQPDDLPPLYIMYTSGSTGAPKGVLGTHSGLINRLIWQYENFPYVPRSSGFEGNSDSDSTNSGEESQSSEEAPNADGESVETDEQKHEQSYGVSQEKETATFGANDDNSEGGEGDMVEASVTMPFRGEVICRRTPLTFVDSMAEMFSPLLAGIPIWAPPPLFIKQQGIAGIVASAASAGVSRLTLLPSQLSSLLQMIPDLGVVWPSLRIVIVSGEACDMSLAARFKVACKDATLLNIYGSTEVGADASYAILCSADTPPSAASLATASLCVNSSQLPQGEGPKSQADIVAHESANDGPGSSERTPWLIGNAPIGYPIKGNELIIARSCMYEESDDDTVHSHSISSGQGFFELVPDGEPGELFVGGKQLAAGYHNRPEETEKRFLPASFLRRADASAGSGGDVAECPSSSMDRVASTDRVFRTGDIVVRIPKGIDGPGSSRVTGYTGELGGSEWAGALVWLGRSDLQVKVRGVRVELEEVERVVAGILQHRLDREGEGEGEGELGFKPVVSAVEADLMSASNRGEGTSERSEGKINITKNRKMVRANIRVKEGLAVAAVSDVDRRSHHLVLVLQSDLAHQMRLDTALEVRRYLLDTIESTYVPASVLLVDQIPRTTTGKIDRPTINNLAAQTVTVTGVRSGTGTGAEASTGTGKEAPTGLQEGTSLSLVRDGGQEDASIETQGSSTVREHSMVELLEVCRKIYVIYGKALSHLSCGAMAEGALDYIGLLLQSYESGLGGESQALTAMREGTDIDTVWTMDFFSLGGDSMSAQPALYYLNVLMNDLHRDPTQRRGNSQNQPNGEATRWLQIFAMQQDVMTLAEILLDGNQSTFYDPVRSLSSTVKHAADIDEKSSNLKRKLDAESDESPVSKPVSRSNESRTKFRNTDRTDETLDLGRTESLLRKVSVYGRTDRWDWFSVLPVNHTDTCRVNRAIRHDSIQGAQHTQDTVGSVCEGGSRSRSAKVGLTQGWSRAMRRCVDSSPLVVTLHYSGVPQQPLGTVSVQDIADCGDGKEDRGVATGKGNGDGERGIEGEWSLGRVYIGSHGGDFSALDAQTGCVVWSVDLEADFNSRSLFEIKEFNHGDRKGSRVGQKMRQTRRQHRVHVEGAATSNVRGSVVYVGCFRGDDVDGVQGEGSHDSTDIGDSHGDGKSDEDDKGGPDVGRDEGRDEGRDNVGRVYALDAQTGDILWSTALGGEVKGAPAVDHIRCIILVGSYDGCMYVLAQDTGKVLLKVPCGGSLYASVVLSSLTVTAHSGCALEAPARGLQTRESAERSQGRPMQSRDEDIVGEKRGRSAPSSGGTAALDAADPETAFSPSVSNDRTHTDIHSTIAFVSTTVGKLIAFGLPPWQHHHPSDSVHSTTSNPPADTLIEPAAVSFIKIWEYDGGAPLFSTPCVTRTLSMTVRTESQGDTVAKGVAWRRDIILIGVVDGTVRCLELKSRVHLKLSEPSDLGGVGEELWRVSFASKPVFSSVCCVDRFAAAIKQYHGRYGSHSGGTANGDRAAIITAIPVDSVDSAPSIYSTRDIKAGRKGDCSAEGESTVPPVFPPLANLTVVFGSHDGYLRGVSPEGTLLWETDLGSVIFSSPCSVPERGLVVAATTAGTVYLVDCKEGTVIQEDVTGDTACPGGVLGGVRLSGEIYSSPVVCGETVYLGCRDDSVHSLHLMS